MTAKDVYLGTGMHMFEKDQLESFRQSVVHPRSGKALLAAVAAVEMAGDYEIGGKSRKVAPRGFEVDPDRAEYLLYEGLYCGATLPASAARKVYFVDICAAHFASTWPIGKWLMDEVVDG
jgi:hypothetical protein